VKRHPRPASADRIFISYRRADSGGWARSLDDSLEEKLGSGTVFRDVAMQGGVDFHEHVESLLNRCDVLLAVIGKRWTSITDDDGNRRLDDPDDLVRGEISRALQRPDVQVIPVLVDGAQMPTERELPPDLAPLSRRQAFELTDSRWEYDVERLSRRLSDLLGEKPRRTSWKAWPARTASIVALLFVGAFVLWFSLKPHGQGAPPVKAAVLRNPTLDRGITFGQYLTRNHLSRDPYTAASLARPGAIVTFDFRIQGYKDKRLPLRWQLVDTRTGAEPDEETGIGIVPKADIDQASWPFWVSVPGSRNRRYFVQIQLYDDRDTVPIGRLRTATFGPTA
jgi:hypothetical protein